MRSCGDEASTADNAHVLVEDKWLVSRFLKLHSYSRLRHEHVRRLLL